MKTLIPTLIALFVIGTTQAQSGSYASLSPSKTSSSYAPVRSEPNEPFIKIKARTDRKILLSWMPMGAGVSHYVLERSLDGRTFEEQGLFFTGDWDTESEYSYVEKLRKPTAGPLFYRLRAVGVDGSVIYTPVTIVHAAMSAN